MMIRITATIACVFLVALMLLYFMESRPLDLWSKKGNKNNSIITVIILVTSYIALRRIALFLLDNTMYNCKKKKHNAETLLHLPLL